MNAPSAPSPHSPNRQRFSGNNLWRVSQALLVPLLLGSCSTSGSPGNSTAGKWLPGDPKSGRYAFEHIVDHSHDNWNYLGLWRRVGDHPPSFAPVDSAKSSVIDEAHGTWVVDAEDGWRFFVPNGGTARYPEDSLLAEAGKVTNRFSKSKTIRRDIGASILVTPLVVAFMPLAMMQEGGFPSGSYSGGGGVHCTGGGGHGGGGGHCGR